MATDLSGSRGKKRNVTDVVQNFVVKEDVRPYVHCCQVIATNSPERNLKTKEEVAYLGVQGKNQLA